MVVKQLFGGLGKNFMNPALGGRAFLMLCYPVAMTTWVAPGIGTGAWADLLGGTKTMAGVDIVSSATPLSADFMHGGCCPMPPSSTHLWAMWAAVSVRSPPWPCCWAACI